MLTLITDHGQMDLHPYEAREMKRTVASSGGILVWWLLIDPLLLVVTAAAGDDKAVVVMMIKVMAYGKLKRQCDLYNYFVSLMLMLLQVWRMTYYIPYLISV